MITTNPSGDAAVQTGYRFHWGAVIAGAAVAAATAFFLTVLGAGFGLIRRNLSGMGVDTAL